jgi:hypothetical protein
MVIQGWPLLVRLVRLVRLVLLLYLGADGPELTFPRLDSCRI